MHTRHTLQSHGMASRGDGSQPPATPSAEGEERSPEAELPAVAAAAEGRDINRLRRDPVAMYVCVGMQCKLQYQCALHAAGTQ